MMAPQTTLPLAQVKSVNHTKGIISFPFLAFGIAWLLWIIPLRLGLSPRSPLFQLAALPGSFGPAIAAIIVRKWITREGFADAGLRLNLGKWRYYLAAWLLPFLVMTVIVVLAAALGIGHADFSLARSLKTLMPQGVHASAPLPALIWAILPIQLMITTLIATPLLWGEEFGWRGYLQLRLFAHRPVFAAVITGLIWGVWHYPLNLRGYNFPNNPIAGLLVFPISLVFLSVIFGWLRQRTGSIWSCCLAHAATNAIGGSLTLLLFAGGPSLIFVSYLGILSWLPLGILSAWIIFTGQLKPNAGHEYSERLAAS